MPALTEDVDASVTSPKELDSARWMAVKRLRLVCGNLPTTLIVTLACAISLAGMLRSVVPSRNLVAWLSTGIVISCMRYARYREFLRLPDHAIDTRLWTRRLLRGTGLSGLFWGGASGVLFPSSDLPHEVLIAFVIAGLCAGAMTSYAGVWRCYALFVVPAVLPLVLRLALEHTEVHLFMAGLGTLFLAAVLHGALQVDRMIGDALRVRAEHDQLLQALHHEATHDPLVDLPNKREFNTRLNALAQSPPARREPFAILFIDLDRFKQVNDTGGHAAGDEVLRRVSQLIRSRVRPTDTVARMGGDEFAVLLPGCSREAAERIAGTLLRAIEVFALPWEGGKVFRVSASIGLTYAQSGEHDIAAMLRAADAACYEAKERGRGRIEMSHTYSRHDRSGRFELSTLRQRVSRTS